MKRDIKEYIEIVGIFGVIASLIFVGMQLMLDRRIAMAEQYYNRAEADREQALARMSSEQFYNQRKERWELGARPVWWDENSDIAKWIENGERSVESLYFEIEDARLRLISADNVYFQYQQGLIAEEFWQSQVENLKNLMRVSYIIRNQFTTGTRPITEITRGLLEELIAEGSIL